MNHTGARGGSMNVTSRTDYTTMRLGKKVGGRKIERCPRCGRKGLVTRYDATDKRPPLGRADHKGWSDGLLFHVEDRCFLSAADLEGAQTTCKL